MNSSYIWILIPLAAAGLLTIFRKYERFTIIAGMVIGAVLALLAWLAPFNQFIDIGPLQMRISSTFSVLGRRFVLGSDDRQLLILIFASVTLWFLGAILTHPGQMFVPVGLASAGVMATTLAVEPFLYAAIFILIAALFSIPVLAPPGHPLGRGTIRFLTFQTLGMPFILFSGWLFERASSFSGAQFPTLIPIVFLGFGILLIMAVFPFHTWIPMLSGEAHPYTAAFVFYIIPSMVSLFGIDFFNRYPWLQNTGSIFTFLFAAGSVMVLTGGIWAAFQTHLGRLMGFAVLIDIGTSLLLIGSASGSPDLRSEILPILVPLLFVRGLALCIWATSLSIIRTKTGSLGFSGVSDAGRKLPFAAVGAVMAHFSLAGFPLLAGFPTRLALLERLADIQPGIILIVLIGMIGLLAGGLRSLVVLFAGSIETNIQIPETRAERIFLAAGTLALFAAGLYLL